MTFWLNYQGNLQASLQNWRSAIKNKISFRYYVTALFFFVLVFGLFTSPSPAQSAPLLQEGGNSDASQTEPGSNEFCLSCHQTDGAFEVLPSGEALDLTVDGDGFTHSIHGDVGLACLDCHTGYEGYPHPEANFENLREFTAIQNESCTDCHAGEMDEFAEGVHFSAHQDGNINAAYCSDCHGAHEVKGKAEMEANAPLICATCHEPIYDLYAQSVHGEALSEGNLDVPTCLDCHGAHSIQSLQTSEFHLFSPQICADCHADEELAAKYDLNPNVVDTYISDFHGTTVQLFEEVSPDQETNKPVCIDCHGVHNIRSADDPESSIVKENLLTTCQRCHPDATEDFPDAWLGHYSPSWEKTPLISSVNLFYQLVIPVTIIGMLVFVVPDGVQRLRKRFGGEKHD